MVFRDRDETRQFGYIVGMKIIRILICVCLTAFGVSIFAQEYINRIPEEIVVRRFNHAQKVFDRDVAPWDYNIQSSFASSELAGDATHSYDIQSALDGDLSTSWADGSEGPGIGEKLVLFHDVGEIRQDYLYVFPGWGGSSATWEKNNQLRKAKITVYGVNKYTVTGGADIKYLSTFEQFTVSYIDKPVYQGIPIGKYLIEDNMWPSGIDLYIVELELLSVYEGSKWNDTVIAEIQILGRSMAAPPVAPEF